ncbi:lipocalin family protein [Spirochaeta cellobiosiphila]|uniref:lipocalin family protein n=1 Tax=Spirochaeta cellobiosiphila TaxID=504483 RepID=UPI000405A2F4|nr:lipocalin family protein [Spirochaeta cellobiosiphila]
MKIVFLSIMILISDFVYAIPNGVKPIDQLDVGKYMGKWYEIARLDFYFEKGLNNTTAEYSLKNNGKIKVVNRGYDFEKDKWKVAKGKAKFQTDIRNGALKVSFFGPFYSEYNIISVDNDYSYALVIGKNTEYMWILSRNKTIPEELRSKYLNLAQKAGILVENLIWVEHGN